MRRLHTLASSMKMINCFWACWVRAMAILSLFHVTNDLYDDELLVIIRKQLLGEKNDFVSVQRETYVDYTTLEQIHLYPIVVLGNSRYA